MPSESKVPAAAVSGDSGSGDALEEVTIDVQQIDAQESQDRPTSSMISQMDQEQEIQQQSVTATDEQQQNLHRATTAMSAAQSNNNEPSTPKQQKAAQSRSTTSYAQHRMHNITHH